MMPVEKAIEAAKTLVKPVNPGQPCVTGPKREQMYTHEFVGANAVVTDLLGAKRRAAIAVKRLQNAASITLELPATGRCRRHRQVQSQSAQRDGGAQPADEPHRRAAGLGRGGRAGRRQGDLPQRRPEQARGASTRRRRCSTHRRIDKDGHHTSKPWEIVRFESNTSIPPKGSASPSYSFALPADAKGPIAVQGDAALPLL